MSANVCDQWDTGSASGMDEVSACAHLLAQHAPLNGPTVGGKSRLGGKRGFARTSTALNGDFPTGNAGCGIQLGGKSQYLHRHVELMM